MNYDAGGQSVVLSATTITAGAGQTLTFSDIEAVNVTNVAGVRVLGDGNANTLTLTRTGATSDAYTLDGGPLVTLVGAASFSFSGQGGADHMQIDETAFGLPQFAGAAYSGHTNTAFNGSSLAPNNIGISFLDNGGASLGVSFSSSHDVAYFDDNVGTSNSGVVNVDGQFSLSFTGLSPLNFVGSGGTLTVNNASDPTNTSLTVQDSGTSSDGVSQVFGDGGFETTTFSGYDNLVVQGLNAGNALTLASVDPNTPASPAGAQALTAVSLQGGSGADTITVNSLPATVTATLFGAGGANQFQLDNVTHNLQAIAGPVIVSPASDTGAASNTLLINDSGDAAARTVQINANTIEGITGDAGSPDIAYGLGSLINQLNIYGGSGGNTFNIQGTQSGSTYNIDTGSAGDTVNISGDAPTNSGDLTGIQGAINLNTGNGTDSLNISDRAGPTRTYAVSKLGGGQTQVSASGVANITYDANLSSGQLENFQLSGASAGGSTYNINNTTATVSNVVNDGTNGGSGGSTFNIHANCAPVGRLKYVQRF